MAKISAGGSGTVLLGAMMAGSSFASNMPMAKGLLGGIPSGALLGGGMALMAGGVAFILASE